MSQYSITSVKISISDYISSWSLLTWLLFPLPWCIIFIKKDINIWMNGPQGPEGEREIEKIRYRLHSLLTLFYRPIYFWMTSTPSTQSKVFIFLGWKHKVNAILLHHSLRVTCFYFTPVPGGIMLPLKQPSHKPDLWDLIWFLGERYN